MFQNVRDPRSKNVSLKDCLLTGGRASENFDCYPKMAKTKIEDFKPALGGNNFVKAKDKFAQIGDIQNLKYIFNFTFSSWGMIVL